MRLVKVASFGSKDVMSLELAPAGLRRGINNRPAEAEVDALPNGLEAFESRWPGHADGNENQARRSKAKASGTNAKAGGTKSKFFAADQNTILIFINGLS